MHTVFFLLALSAAALAAQPVHAESSFHVQWKGSLHAVHHGDSTARLVIEELGDLTGINAVGPVANLDGEITIMDGDLYVSRVRGDDVVTEADARAGAAFLVWAKVDRWMDPISLGEAIGNHGELESRVASLARQMGLNTEVPFPFLIKGSVESMQWHVLAPFSDEQVDTHHLDAALKIASESEQVQLVGFFSTSHQGVFTHRNSHAHIHVVTSRGHTGHVDRIALGKDATIRFPEHY